MLAIDVGGSAGVDCMFKDGGQARRPIRKFPGRHAGSGARAGDMAEPHLTGVGGTAELVWYGAWGAATQQAGGNTLRAGRVWYNFAFQRNSVRFGQVQAWGCISAS